MKKIQPNIVKTVKLYLYKIVKWQYFGLLLLVLLSLGLHFSAIVASDDLIFDENYYVSDAKSIIAQEGTLLPQHPPLGKLFIVTGIRIFGDNPFGWRFFSVIFGTVSLVLIYLICKSLKMSNEATMIATGLFGFENLTFVQSSIAMLDVYSLTFFLLSLLFYLRNRFVLSGLFAGFSMLAKIPGVFVLGIFLFVWLLVERKKWQSFVVPALVAAVTLIGLLPLLEYAVSGQFLNPFQQIGDMVGKNYLLKFAETNLMFESRPWDWLMNRGAIFYSYDPQYIAIISPTITAAIVPLMLYMLYRAIKRNRAALLVLLWFSCAYLPWAAITLFMQRMTYIYYVYPAIGAVCIGLGLVLSELIYIWKEEKRSKIYSIGLVAMSVYLVIHIGIFFILSPLGPPIIEWLNV